jgi:hypothetical protein
MSQLSNRSAEWGAFLGLIPYFVACPGPWKFRDRLLTSLPHDPELVITREAILLRAGLSFFTDDLGVDLALMQLVREGLLLPIADIPFTFVLCGPQRKEADRCTPSSKTGYQG